MICEDNVFIGPSVVFTNIINPRSEIDRKHLFAKTYICKGASIGANATIICGNKIGEYSLIGAGSVVTKNILPFALVVGNPAKQIGWVSEKGIRLKFGKDNTAICLESNQEYKLIKNQVIKVVK